MKTAMSRRTGLLLARLVCAAALVGSVSYAAPSRESSFRRQGGGTLDTLSFAIVGDCRPPTVNDTAGYPTAIITKIWQDIQAQSPQLPFAVTTGNYCFASPNGNQAGPQMDLYLTARSNFTGSVFYAMGNDECTGATTSNCGPGNANGVTNDYSAFLTHMLAPIGEALPYYTVFINGTNNAWTAKFVFVASNAWNSTQATWLAGALSQPTTYTFIVMNAGTYVSTAPSISGGVMSIIDQYPYTLLIVGHTHTYEYFASKKEVVVGNGGAPLSGSVNYGYVIAQQQSNGSILFQEHDYITNAVQHSFTVQ